MKTLAVLILSAFAVSSLACGSLAGPTDRAGDAGEAAEPGGDGGAVDGFVWDAALGESQWDTAPGHDLVAVEPPWDAGIDDASAGTADGMVGLDVAAPPACSTQVLAGSPPALLSQTGCFVAGAPTRPTDEFMPYEVNSPLWSDGAAKDRYLWVPPGSTISVKECDRDPGACLPLGQGGSPQDEGHFDLPPGTILIKGFSVQGRRIETRLFMRASATSWKAYSYAWNDAGTDATLELAGTDRGLGAQIWHYPSQTECMQCHTLSAGRSLGLTSRQLDRLVAGGNQLDILVARGWLSNRPKALAPLPDPGQPGPVEGRARSYLQTNCSFCHRPGTWIGDLDLRYAASFLDMHLCNVPVEHAVGYAGVPQVRVVPGKPAESALSYRMHDRGGGYGMPKIGSNLVDPEGSALIDRWISELPGCPE